ncbi:uncharacterized protein LAESUDRAFT_627679, partial [Laetiporus sulphureus 93-53]
HVLCYPVHITHVYQGLDIVVFSVLKKCWSEERDKWHRAEGAVTKKNFLSIYGAAHVQVLTKEVVETAFQKMRVWPFNPDAI